MQVEEIAKLRFESFRLGTPSPTVPAAPAVSKHRHARSHSRNASISSIVSLPTPQCTTTYDIPSGPSTQSLPPPPKRNSHHRRVSSVSTRRESAEMMGVSVPPDPVSPAEDAGEKDSIRRHALWALEGKRDASFSKVEIPELTTPFEFPTKPSFPPGSGAFMNTSKRDSFKPSSSKDYLGPLVEEEEEEDDSVKPRAPLTPTTPTTPFMRNLSARPRPPHLRPLSLTPDNLPSHTPTSERPPSPRRSSLKLLALSPDATTFNATIMNRSPTAPSPTPLRPRPVLNLKLSNEAPSSNVVVEQSEEKSARPQPLRKSSISYKTSTTSSVTGLPTPESTPTTTERRYSGFSHSSISSRGSLSSTTSNTRLSVTDDDFSSTSASSRPLSASEQHFLFKSHNALLARITDLERALSFRNSASNFREAGSRPSSVASAASAVSGTSSHPSEPGEPLDEMVCLVADLKAERDELKRDVEGWRVRVADLEKQLGVVGNRVEVERREAWVARTRVGLLEVERNGLEKRVGDLEAENERLVKGEEDLKQQVARLLQEKEQLASELQDVKTKSFRETDPLSTPRAFGGPVVTMRPVAPSLKRGLGFTSVTSLDSESSATDVEDGPGAFQSYGLGFKLRAVEEEEGADGEEEDDSGLAGYEDEDENDVLLSPSSSFGSTEDFFPPPRTVAEVPTPSAHVPQSTPSPAPTMPVPPAPLAAPAQTHASRGSLSKWTFPRGAIQTAERNEPEVDRFFGCLEDLDDPPSPSSPLYSEYDEEKSKGLFAKGFNYGADANSCFVLPASVLASVEGSFVLDVVEEEDEDEVEEDEAEETEGETVVEDGEINNGIKITFTPPAEDRDLQAPMLAPPVSPPSPSRKPVPSFAFFEEEEDAAPRAPFNFGLPRSETPESPVETKPSSSVVARPTPPSPSSIPRFTAAKPAFFTLASPPRSNSPSGNNAFVTPPTKRGGQIPSFIPQPTSPSRNNLPKSPPPLSTNASTKPSTTFIRQPSRQPLMSNTFKNQNTNADTAPHTPPRYADHHAAARPGADMKSAGLSSDDNIPTAETPKPSAASDSNSSFILGSSSFSSIMSSPLAGRLSFQTFTNYIPSWGGMTSPTSPRGTPSDAVGHDSRPVAPPAGPVKRGYVSKQSQLERLKTRFEREGVDSRNVGARKGDADAVFL